jgi:hypothetical protein
MDICKSISFGRRMSEGGLITWKTGGQRGSPQIGQSREAGLTRSYWRFTAFSPPPAVDDIAGFSSVVG